MYEVKIERKALKSLEKISPPYYLKIKNAILKLAEEPRPSGCKKLTDVDAYRIRVADYRIIYNIQDDVLIVNVIHISHRKEAY